MHTLAVASTWGRMNEFKTWAQRQLSEKFPSWTPADLHRAVVQKGVKVSEAYVYRVVQGRSASQQVGYEIALAIGEVLGSAADALRAAGYRLPEELYRPTIITDSEGGNWEVQENAPIPAEIAEMLQCYRFLSPHRKQ